MLEQWLKSQDWLEKKDKNCKIEIIMFDIFSFFFLLSIKTTMSMKRREKSCGIIMNHEY